MELVILMSVIALAAILLFRKFGRGDIKAETQSSNALPFDRLVRSYKAFQKSQGSSSTDEIRSSIIEIRNSYAKDTSKENFSDAVRIFAATALYDERNHRRNGVYAVDILSDLYLGPIKEKAGPDSDDVRVIENFLVKTVGTAKSLYRMSLSLRGGLEGTDADFIDQVESLVLGDKDTTPQADAS